MPIVQMLSYFTTIPTPDSPSHKKEIEFLPSSPSPTKDALGKKKDLNPSHYSSLKEQALYSEKPFRLRLNQQCEESGLSSVARDLIGLRCAEHDVSDVVDVLPRPTSAISIPSKCRFVLNVNVGR